jgi:Helix-turn-helix domain
MRDSSFPKSAEAVERLWTDKQVAAFLHVSLATVRRWRLRGAGPAFYRVGARIKYDPRECAAWLESRRSDGQL